MEMKYERSKLRASRAGIGLRHTHPEAMDGHGTTGRVKQLPFGDDKQEKPCTGKVQGWVPRLGQGLGHLGVVL